MITIESVEQSFYESTFSKLELLTTFQERYKNFQLKLSFTSMYTSGVSKIIYEDLIKAERISAIVTDHGSGKIFELRITDSTGIRTAMFQQMPGFCGAIMVIGLAACFDELHIRELLEDLFFLMGYTVIFVSTGVVREARVKSLQETGYNIYMEIKNRRTRNTIAMFYKRLKTNLL